MVATTPPQSAPIARCGWAGSGTGPKRPAGALPAPPGGGPPGSGRRGGGASVVARSLGGDGRSEGGAGVGVVGVRGGEVAAVGRGFGFGGVPVRDAGGLARVHGWLHGPREGPLLIDAKVTSAHGSWWLEEAFRGH